MANNPQTRCHLLSLPPELRNCIYEYVLYTPVVSITHKPNSTTSPTALSLLQTCHQVRKEAAGIFYTINDINIHGQSLRPFIRASSEFRLRSIESITVHALVDYTEDLTFCLRPVVGLKHLKILTLCLETHMHRCNDGLPMDGCVHAVLHDAAIRTKDNFKGEKRLIAQLIARMPRLQQIFLVTRTKSEEMPNLRALENDLQRMVDRSRARRKTRMAAEALQPA